MFISDLRLCITKNKLLELLQCVNMAFIECAYCVRYQENESCNEMYKKIPHFYMNFIKAFSSFIIITYA